MAFAVPNVLDATFPPQASLDSGDLAILAAGAGLTGVQSGCAVSAQGTPNMTVAVAAGVARIGGRRVAVTAGNVTIAAADATSPRHDLITVDTTGTLASVAGTPAGITATGEPVFPAIPAGRVVLAAVYVPASAATVTAGQITDKRVTLAGLSYEDVTWYGAVGDGTTDDTTAIQAAVTAAGARASSSGAGATVRFPALTFKISAAISVPSNVMLIGAGFRSTVVTQVTTTAHGFTTAGGQREIVIRDMRIKGPASGSGDGIYLAATGTYAVFDCELTNLLVDGWGRYGVHTEDLCESTIQHVRSENNGNHGFYIADNGTSQLGGTSITMTACYANANGAAVANIAGFYVKYVKYSVMNGCASDSNDQGYVIDSCSGIAVNGSGCEATTVSPGHAFVVQNGSTNIQLNGCWCTNLAAATGIGFLVTAAAGANCSRIVFIGCRVQGSTVPAYSAQVDASNQAIFMGFQKHPSAGINMLGDILYLGHENNGFSAFSVEPTSTDEPFMVARGTASTDYAYSAKQKGETGKRWRLRSDGQTEWGDGTGTYGVTLARGSGSNLVLAQGATNVLKTGQNATASRPSAATVGKGAQFYDTTLNLPIWSDGTNWKNAAGTTV